MTISNQARNIYSYAGEDGILEHLCNQLGLSGGLCVEFGAGDGFESSNTALLRDKGWGALLIEADDELFRRLNKLDSRTVETWHGFIRPTGGTSIDALLRGRQPEVMSIDVDGDDYFIFDAMESRPTIVVVEYNQTVPWFLDVRAARTGNLFGASALSLYRVARRKGYVMAAATETNLIFVVEGLAGADLRAGWGSYERIMKELPLRCGITITNYCRDRYELNYGNLPKWGFPPAGHDELVVDLPLYPATSQAISDRCAREMEPLL